MNLNPDYILPSISGRLGNNLFMIANAYAIGLEYNKQVVVARSQLRYEGNDYSKNIFSKIDFIEHFIDGDNINPKVPSDYKPNIYSGYFQSEKYFKKYSESIKSIFGPPLDFVNRVLSEIPILSEEKITAINIRRGDYLIYSDYHPVITPEYCYKASEKIETNHYLIISDDIEWCRNNLKFENSTFLEGYKPHEQLWIMSLCRNFIISNSSFSWWGSYLSRNKNKIVVAPKTWFGPRHKEDWSDIYCTDWIVLPTFYESGNILPI